MADYIDKTYGRLTVKGLIYKQIGKYKTAYFIGECSCGNIAKEFLASDVKNGKAKNCGCLRKERSVETHTKHGQHTIPDYIIYGKT